MLQTSNEFSCRALALDLLVGMHRMPATIWSTDMSISGVTGTSALRQQLATASPQSKSSTTTQASSTTASSTGGTGSPFFSVDDGISVGLPNGMSIGVFHLAQSAGSTGQGGGTSAGSSSDASYSQMIASIEQLVAAFENSPASASASSTAAQTSSTDGTSAGGNGASATSDSGSNASMDGISVDLPNGLSVEVFHAEQGNETSADSAASFAQMANTMEQLVAALDKYPSAAAGAYASANTSSTSTATGSLNAVA
jgi:hypothetical protein